MNHSCIEIYEKFGEGFSVGNKSGVCRITGQHSTGIKFEKWVKDTFTDHASLVPGTIISNAAAFCFVEDSAIIQQKTGRDKAQRFRTYSHIVTQMDWFCLTKADKKLIKNLICSGECKIVCLTDSGQKHIFFKHRPGFWQLDEMFVKPDIAEFERIHGVMMRLLSLGFGQEQIKTGQYYQSQIIKVGVIAWQQLEAQISAMRGEPLFDFAAWLMFNEKIQE